MAIDNQTKKRGIGCLTVVGIVFVILKLLEIEPVAHWSWWWVTLPFWLPYAIGLAIALLIIVLVGISNRN